MTRDKPEPNKPGPADPPTVIIERERTPLFTEVEALYTDLKPVADESATDTTRAQAPEQGTDPDVLPAARAPRVPAWLAQRLTAATHTGSSLVIHVRTDHIDPFDAARAYLAQLVRGLGQDTSAAVFDIDGDQIAHLLHPAAAI